MLRGEYVRSRQQVKALGMEEVSVGDPAALRGEYGFAPPPLSAAPPLSCRVM